MEFESYVACSKMAKRSAFPRAKIGAAAAAFRPATTQGGRRHSGEAGWDLTCRYVAACVGRGKESLVCVCAPKWRSEAEKRKEKQAARGSRQAAAVTGTLSPACRLRRRSPLSLSLLLVVDLPTIASLRQSRVLSITFDVQFRSQGT